MKTLSCERHACARPKSQIFWNWVPEYIPDLQKCVGFQNSKKMLNHSTLVYSMVSTTHCKHALAMSVTDLHTVTSTNSSQWCNRLAYTWVNSLPTIIWLPAYNLNLSLLKRMQRYMSGFCLYLHMSGSETRHSTSNIVASAPLMMIGWVVTQRFWFFGGMVYLTSDNKYLVFSNYLIYISSVKILNKVVISFVSSSIKNLFKLIII